MALQKQVVEISFAKGLDTKTDPFRLAIGNFVGLKNSVFDVLGRLTKRNGFASITSLTNPASYLTTFNGNLTAIGTALQAFSQGSNTWVNSGSVQPVRLNTLPLIRNSVNQNQCDTAISANNLLCTVYSETDGTTTSHKYVVADATTGQNVIAPTALAADVTYGAPKVFYLGTYFIVVYTNHPSAYNLKYISINTINLGIGAPVTVSTSVTPAATQAFDGIVFNNTLYLAWNGASASGIKIISLSSTLVLSTNVNPDSAHVATMISVCADSSANVIWASYYDSVTSAGYTLAVQAQTLVTVLTAHQIITAETVLNITSSVQNAVNTILYEVSNAYSYDSSVKSNYVKKITCAQSGFLGSAAVVLRSLGLASKSFIINSQIYFLGAYSSSYQPTYFLVNGSTSTQTSPVVIAKLAYTNGGGYLPSGLPSVAVNGTSASVAYLYKDLIQAVNKNTNVPAGSQINGIYSQTGINLVEFDLTTDGLSTVEIGSALQMSGGFMWMFDGYVPVEQNFFVYPDSIEGTTSGSGGSISAQLYYYQFTYEWSDNQGNIHRSAPSIPYAVTTSGSTSSNTLNIPNLRLTYKTANQVKIVGYRWSTAQPVYYQFTSIAVPSLNSTTSDSIAIVDTNADATLLGNNIIYTNGGVVENENAPAATDMTLFDTRVWMIDSEDQDLLRYSKQIIENTPVEMSELFTMYIAPSSSVQHTTGKMKCIFPMDDKLIIFKPSSLYYVNGVGPDNTGSNNQYSEPVFITSPVGSDNPNSIVLIPNGLMFQSSKGIWLLERNLSVTYIGAAVEAYNSDTVLSALAIPNTNRVVFKMSSGVDLFYDYFVNQWGIFTGISGVSSTIYQGLYTFLSAPITVTPPTAAPYTIASQVYQETPGLYLDGANPVLMSFTTGWISAAGLQGYKRAYWMELLGSYISPHKLSIGIAYDFNPSIVQLAGVQPDNYSAPWGADSVWGESNPWGGSSTVEQWQINFKQQTCQSFQITLQEFYDSSFGAPAGAGLTISSLELVVGLKKAYPRNIPANHRTG